MYLKSNPGYVPVGDRALVDELDFNKFINHQTYIYEKELFEQIRLQKVAEIDAKVDDIKKAFEEQEEDIYRQFDREALDYTKKEFSIDMIEYPQPTVYASGDFQFPFKFNLPCKLPGR